MSIVRNLLAVIAGIATFVLLIMAIERLGPQLQLPSGTKDGEADKVRAFLSMVPVGVMLLIGLAFMVGAFAGTVVASIIGTLKPLYFGIIVGGLILAYILSFLVIVPYPWWFRFAAPIAVALATYAAIQLMERSTS